MSDVYLASMQWMIALEDCIMVVLKSFHGGSMQVWNCMHARDWLFEADVNTAQVPISIKIIISTTIGIFFK